MKKYLMIIQLLISTVAFGQARYVNGLKQAKYGTYLCKVYKVDSTNRVLIKNINNKHDGTRAANNNWSYDDAFLNTRVDCKAIDKIFKEEISPNTIVSLNKSWKNFITVQLAFSRNGIVDDVIFGTRASTPIDLDTFSRIENRIKKEISASFSDKVYPPAGKPLYQTYNYIPYNYTVDFTKINVN